MKIVVDENVSIAELAEKRMSDEDVYALILHERAVLITRDYHLTNPIRFPTDKTKGIIYVRHGSLKSEEEVTIVENFLSAHNWERFQGRLVTL